MTVSKLRRPSPLLSGEQIIFIPVSVPIKPRKERTPKPQSGRRTRVEQIELRIVTLAGGSTAGMSPKRLAHLRQRAYQQLIAENW